MPRLVLRELCFIHFPLSPDGVASWGSFLLQFGAFVCWIFLFREPAPISFEGLARTFLVPGGRPGFLLVTAVCAGAAISEFP